MAVVDLALPFGWTGSPAHYGTFGGAIVFLVARESPNSLDLSDTDKEPFFSYVWVDDHILIEVDRGNRLVMAETALKLSMMAVLGPHAINDKKFSSWSSKLNALGLDWDTEKRTVAMPPDKIEKARARIRSALSATHVRKHQLEKLLGSLRHVGLCCRASRAFIQRLHQTWRQSSKFAKISLPSTVRQDLRWIESMLQHGRMNEISTGIIAGTNDPVIHLFMDASNTGLCVLYPTMQQYIRARFDQEERAAIEMAVNHIGLSFSINVRETLCAVFAVLLWGPTWSHVADQQCQPLHVRCWIDNEGLSTLA